MIDELDTRINFVTVALQSLDRPAIFEIAGGYCGVAGAEQARLFGTPALDAGVG